MVKQALSPHGTSGIHAYFSGRGAGILITGNSLNSTGGLCPYRPLKPDCGLFLFVQGTPFGQIKYSIP